MNLHGRFPDKTSRFIRESRKYTVSYDEEKCGLLEIFHATAWKKVAPVTPQHGRIPEVQVAQLIFGASHYR